MSLITDNTLAQTIDLPVALAATEVKQGDWLTIASFVITAPMRLRYKFMTFQMLGASITNLSDIGNANKINDSQDLATIGLYLNFDHTTHPALQNAIDLVQIRNAYDLAATCIPVSQIQGQFITVRTAPEIVATTAGVYTFVIGNNMKENSDPNGPIPQSTSIDFNLCVTGAVRIELLPN